MKKEKMKIMGCIALVGCITLSIAGCNSNKVKEVESTESVTESTEVEEVKLTDKVTGIKDWTVEVNTEGVDFMSGITWEEEYVSSVTVDDSKVDLTKVGEYTLTYTIKGKSDEKETQDASVDVIEAEETETEEPTETETTTVEVISEEETQAKVDSGEDVTTSETTTKSTTSTNTASSSGSSNTTSVVETPKAHEHNWQPVYTTVHHDAVTHTEQQDQGHYEEKEETYYYIGFQPDIHYTDYNEMLNALKDVARKIDSGELPDDLDISTKGYGYTVKTWVPNVVTVTITDQEAYDEQVIDHYECSCGATK